MNKFMRNHVTLADLMYVCFCYLKMVKDLIVEQLENIWLKSNMWFRSYDLFTYIKIRFDVNSKPDDNVCVHFLLRFIMSDEFQYSIQQISPKITFCKLWPTCRVKIWKLRSYSKIIERRKAQDAELKLYLLLEREIRMGAISASECFVSHW